MPQVTNANRQDGFPYYPALPEELKLMVWDLYKQNLPVVRHYCSVDAGRGDIAPIRVYGAISLETKTVVNSSATPDWTGVIHSAAGNFTRLQLAGPVWRLGDPDNDKPKISFAEEAASIVWADNSKGARTLCTHSPASREMGTIIANFERDIFYFGYTGSQQKENWNYLQFLAPTMTRPQAKLSSRHWFFRVQRLGLVLNSATPRPLKKFDREALASHGKLKEVHIVIPLDRVYHSAKLAADRDGVVLWDQVVQLHQDRKHPDRHLSGCRCPIETHDAPARALEQELSSIFESSGRNVAVSIVVEHLASEQKKLPPSRQRYPSMSWNAEYARLEFDSRTGRSFM